MKLMNKARTGTSKGTSDLVNGPAPASSAVGSSTDESKATEPEAQSSVPSHLEESNHRYKEEVQRGIDQLDWWTPENNTLDQWRSMASSTYSYADARMSEVGPSPYRVPRDGEFRDLQRLYEDSQKPNSTIDIGKLKERFSTFAFYTIANETELVSNLQPHESMFNASIYGARLPKPMR
jgi:hypothetical protein